MKDYIIPTFIFPGLLLLLVLAIWLFATGIHNIDRAWNLAQFEIVTGSQTSELTLPGFLLNVNELWTLGLSQLYIGFMLSIASVIGLVMLWKQKK